jgi:putative NADPH-quinone reductase
MHAKKLIAYFSASGVTAGKAAQLARAASADLWEIAPAQAYTPADLDWQDSGSRTTLEMKDPACRPALAKALPDLSGYEEICVGFPIWWHTAPRIINTFLESGAFSGKKITLFATSGGSGIGQAVRDLKRQYPNLAIAGGKLLNGSVSGGIL